MTEIQQIISKKAPLAIGPYSQGIKAGCYVFASGQIPIDPKNGGIAEGGIAEQTAQALENLKAVLEAAGAALCDVVKTTVFLKDMSVFSAMNDVYACYFQAPYPARSCIEVSRLPKDVHIEIEAVAVCR